MQSFPTDLFIQLSFFVELYFHRNQTMTAHNSELYVSMLNIYFVIISILVFFCCLSHSSCSLFNYPNLSTDFIKCGSSYFFLNMKTIFHIHLHVCNINEIGCGKVITTSHLSLNKYMFILYTKSNCSFLDQCIHMCVFLALYKRGLQVDT